MNNIVSSLNKNHVKRILGKKLPEQSQKHHGFTAQEDLSCKSKH